MATASADLSASDPGARWLAAQGLAALGIEPLPGDVSPRRYARVALPGGASAILATYPAEARDACARFERTTALLEAAGVRVPRILALGCGDGFMLVEDLGQRVLADLAGRPWDELAAYFRDALGEAARIATLEPAAVAAINPPLDRALLERELQQTWDLFLAPRGLLGTEEEAAALRAVLGELLDRLAEDPPRPCHRDFMARNLVPLAGAASPKVAVLDHQDLRLGPPAYDLASLLNDTLFPPPEVEEAILAEAAPRPAARLRYHRAAAQRTLKAVGTYASFARRGSDRHLPLIPETLGRCLAHLRRTPEGEDLAPLLAELWRPALGALPH
jgi:aminoglycoside/choline kinase family phosphotransferase